ASFQFMLAFAVIAFVVVYFDLGETNHHRAPNFTQQFKSYPELFRSRRFWGYAGTAGFTSGTFFAYLGGGPFVATELLGLSPSVFGLYFAFIALGYAIGNFLAGRYSARAGINRMMLTGNMIMVMGMLLAIVLFA